MTAPIFLFTDFGSADIYVGQVKAVLAERAPESAVIDLPNDAPDFATEASAHLLAALVQRLPRRAVTLAVVDPGVGTSRGAVAVEADDRWFVGPDNGLMSVLAARAATTRIYSLPEAGRHVSVSFHGRDVFAPLAARLAAGEPVPATLRPQHSLQVALGAEDLAQVIYVDHYGNIMTGLRGANTAAGAALRIEGRTIPRARVFGEVDAGALFWYENSLGLVEIAANRASAADLLCAAVGDTACPV